MSKTTEDTLSISEVAKFFDQSISWMRWIEKTGVLKKEDGTPIEIARTKKRSGTSHGYRRYTYQNIADIAEALFRSEKISRTEYNAVMERVRVFS